MRSGIGVALLTSEQDCVYAAFFAALTLAQRARCAAAILLRAPADIVRFGAATPFRLVLLLAFTFAQRAF
jgi:hypothetical protein